MSDSRLSTAADSSAVKYVFLTSAARDQIDQIFTLYRSAGWWEDPDNPALIQGIIKGSHCFLVAVVQSRIMGMGRVISDGVSDAYIQDVAVHPDEKGKGIGTGIVQRLVDRIRSDGLSWIGLIAESDTEHFYTRLGFKPMRRSKPMLIKAPWN